MSLNKIRNRCFLVLSKDSACGASGDVTVSNRDGVITGSEISAWDLLSISKRCVVKRPRTRNQTNKKIKVPRKGLVF